MTPTPPWRDAAGTTAFAVSLTALMAAALFVSAAVNPDSAGYGDLPWYYAGGSLVAAGAFYVLSRRYDRGPRAVVTRPDGPGPTEPDR